MVIFIVYAIALFVIASIDGNAIYTNHRVIADVMVYLLFIGFGGVSGINIAYYAVAKHEKKKEQKEFTA